MKKIKIITTILLIIFIILMLTTKVQADSELTWSNIKSTADSFLDKGKNASGGLSTDDIKTIVKDLGSLLMGIAVVILLGISAVMGIKWMTATPEVQAKLKQQLIGLAISAGVIFGAQIIWKIVFEIMETTIG